MDSTPAPAPVAAESAPAAAVVAAESAPAAEVTPAGNLTQKLTSLVDKVTAFESSSLTSVRALERTVANDAKNLERAVTTELKDIKNDLKALQRDMARFLKSTQSGKKSKKSAGGSTATTRRNSGFEKPTGISDQLADFLSIERGTLLPRMEVTKKINAYIRENNLQNPSDRRQIIPDDKLRAILNVSPETEVSYFNYQGFLKGHFIAPPAAPVAVDAAAAN